MRNLFAGMALMAAVAAAAAAPDGAPRYVFYFIGDGMGLGPQDIRRITVAVLEPP